MRKLVLVSVIGLVGMLGPTSAQAHFTLNSFVIGSDTKMPISWMSQDKNGGPQKNGPCAAMPNTGLGDVAGTTTGIITAVPADGMINVSVTATIAHPGWYRVALVEGASSTQTLTTLPDPKAMSGTNCTPPIMSNPVWSTTQPVLADGLPMGSTASTSQTGTKMLPIKIPASASCTMAKPCSLQVIMVMTDHPANDCYYHHCADITIASSEPADGGAGGGAGGVSGSGGASNDASVSPDASASGGATSSGGASSSGGATASGGSSSTGGASSSGGSSSSGGALSSGGVTASGGTTSSGGAQASGGSSGSGGMSGSGGSTSPGASSGGGCNVVASASTAPFAAMLLGIVLVARARRRRRD